MSKKANTLPILLDAVWDGNNENGPIGGQTEIDLTPWQEWNQDTCVFWCLMMFATTFVWWNVYISTVVFRFNSLFF